MTLSTPRRRRARGAVIVLVVGLGLLVSACLPSPIHPNNRPTTIPNAQNGYIGRDSLRAVAPNCEIWRGAAPSLGSMIAAARRDGVHLWTEECYRDYAGQVAVRNWWCAQGNCNVAAVPGRSNHGWAKAADFADQDGELTFQSKGYAWLRANAATYGWNHPGSMGPNGSNPEPWHWEWVGDGGQMYPGQLYGVGNAASLPPGGDPTGSFDIAQGSTAGNPLIHVAGWTIDPDTEVPTDVHIYVDGKLHNISAASRPRGDIGATYPLWGASHGFDKWLGTAAGTHQVCVWAINEYRRGVNINLGCRQVWAA